MSIDIVKEFRKIPDNLFRNIAISAHIDSGKTTLTERILFFTGRIHKTKEVHDGGATMDFMEQEKKRGITIASAATTAIWKGHRLNIIDTPGHVDFTVEVERSMRVLDGCVIVFDSVAGVEPQSETVWRQANKYNLPRICFVNKMDRAGANFEKCVKEIRERLSPKGIIIALPVGSEREFSGIIDILAKKYIHWTGKDNGLDFEYRDIPDEYLQQVNDIRNETIEKIVDCDEQLMNKILEGQDISVDELKQALRKGVIAGELIPIACGSALKNIGVQFLLDLVVDYFPSPLECPTVYGNLYDKDPQDTTKVPMKTNRNDPLCCFIFKTQFRKSIGNVAYVRMYSGTLKKGSTVFNANSQKEERISRIVLIDANDFHDVDEIYAYEVAAILFRERSSKTGETLCDANYKITMDGITIPDPVIAMSIEAEDQKSTLALIEALKEKSFDDPSLKFFTKDKQLLISGVGELHLEIVKERLETENNLKVRLGQPKVAYQITIKNSLKEGYIHKKQSGGAGEFAEIILSVKPKDRDILDKKNVTTNVTPTPKKKDSKEIKENENRISFANEVVSGNIPTEYIPAVMQGIFEASSEGVGGCPLVDIDVTLWDGSYHSVDSNSTIFKNTAHHFFINLCKKAGLVYLEPIMKVVVNLDGNANPYYGDVSGDIAKRRGIQGNESNNTTIVAEVPLSEMFGYVNTLRSLTKGYGSYSMEFSKYNIMPDHLVESLVFKNTNTTGK
jgi:elongation factor G